MGKQGKNLLKQHWTLYKHRWKDRAEPNLLVDVLDELCSFLLYCVSIRLPLCLPSREQPEIGLGVDVVEASAGHQQLSSPQLHVLQEGQTSLALPRSDPLPQVPPAGPQACKRKHNGKIRSKEGSLMLGPEGTVDIHLS